MPEAAPGGPTGLPKLTVGQRVLAALPSLQRQPRPTTPRPAAGRTSGSGPGSGTPRGTTARSGGSQRPNPYAEWTVPELRERMKFLDPQERRVAMLIAPVLAGLDLWLTSLTIHNNPAVGHKGHSDPGQILWLGVASAVVALLVVVAAFFRRRSFTIFTLAFSGFGGGPVTVLPALFVMGWLLVRFNRMQKALYAKTGGGPAASREAAAKRRAERTAARKKGKAPEPAGPPPNKRYTPPKASRS